MKRLYIILSILIPSLIFGQFVKDVSKRGTTAAPFLNISQGARATAMGSAFVAVADDPSTVFWNPAGVARLPQNTAMFDHTNWFADISYNFASATINIGDFGALGASFIASDISDMRVTTIDEPNGTGERFTVSDVAFSLTWAYNITENFTIGFNPKVIYQNIWKMSDYAFALDIGVLYNTPFDGIVLGMAITNFGSKMQLQGTNAVVLYDGDETTTGNNGRIPANLQTDKWDLPLGFKVGISYHPIKTGAHDLLIAADAAHPNDNYEYVNVGGEYTFKDMFSIRGGYKTLFLEDSEESLTLGAGLKQHLMGNISIRFDYAWEKFGILKNIQKFSVGVNF